MKNVLLTLAVCVFLVAPINAQTHTIEIHQNNRVASLLMEADEYNNWIVNDQFNNAGIRHALFQDIYQMFDDDFDFIFLILNEDERPDNLPFGQLIQVSNAVQGIGKNIYNNASNYGSDGKLKAVMHLTKRTYLRSGPSLHEVMHNWGNSAIYTETVSTSGDNLDSFPFQPHWGFTGGSNRGQLGGFDQNSLVENGSNSYTVDSFGPNANGGNSIPYTEFELYLMGMIPITDVTDFDVFTDITSLTVNTSTFDFVAQGRTTYTSTSLASLLGPRIPSYQDSQKDFKLLVMVLTNTPLTDAQWNLLDDHSEKFGRIGSDDASHTHNFWEATNGLGTMETGNLQDSLGVNDVALNDAVKIYPNPTSDELYIEFSEQQNMQSIIVYNSLGQQVLYNTLNAYQNTHSISVRNFPSGLYYIHLKDDKNQVLVKKVVVK
ncbi:T9SS type A sorting domain-containing protein [Winogradskyella sp. 3972H.M.0a.05]|uniref:T9SS type A sorting domain-containing protein n=1 Tax=Winogradskyella sp. 3972H.M.0a.05 TaxID=2950277 RepID=UPI00339B3D80